MSMSKRDYEAVAKVLNETACDWSADLAVSNALRRVAEDLADVFAADNSRFDRARFVKAAVGS